MNELLLSILLLLFSYSLAQSQITVTRATLPNIGDTLYINSDPNPTGIFMTPPGGRQRWDYSSLQSPYTKMVVIKDAMDHSKFLNFPAASFTAEMQRGVIGFYQNTPSALQLLGFIGKDPFQLGLNNLQAFFSPPYTQREAILDYQDDSEISCTLPIIFSADQLSDDFFSNTPVIPDSLRIHMEIIRSNVVDAWGTLKIPEGSYEVLREKRVEKKTTRLEVKVGILDWQDVTDSWGNQSFLGASTEVSYHFYSNETKQPIAIVHTARDQQTATKIEYKGEPSVGNIVIPPAVTYQRPGVYASPNPAIAETNFEFSNLPAGNYELVIYNILGVKVWEKNYTVRGDLTDKVSLTQLRKGTYLYSLLNDSGKAISTKRLMVVRP